MALGGHNWPNGSMFNLPFSTVRHTAKSPPEKSVAPLGCT